MAIRTLTKARAVGGSLMVTIPKELAEAENLRAGEMVEIEVKKSRKSFFGALKGIGPFSKEGELKAHDQIRG